MESIAIICIGSNATDGEARIASAAAMLESCGTFLATTPVYPSEPEYDSETDPYVNRIVSLRTPLSQQELEQQTKAYQTDVREQADCTPLVAIDIDIVAFNGAILRPADFRSRYFRKGMMLLYDVHQPDEEFAEKSREVARKYKD